MKNNNIKLNTGIGFTGKYRIKTYKAGTKKLLRQTDWIKNLIVVNEGSGLNIIVKQLLNDTTYALPITKAKIGDDNTAPTDNDTDLGNTLVDNIAVASAVESADNIATFQFFISDDDLPDDTYEEFGIFSTNQLFARSIISPAYTKVSGEDTTIEYVLTASNS